MKEEIKNKMTTVPFIYLNPRIKLKDLPKGSKHDLLSGFILMLLISGLLGICYVIVNLYIDESKGSIVLNDPSDFILAIPAIALGVLCVLSLLFLNYRMAYTRLLDAGKPTRGAWMVYVPGINFWFLIYLFSISSSKDGK